MVTSVVVPLDGSPASARALGTAASLARRARASVHLLTVTSPGLGSADDELMLKKVAATLPDLECTFEVIESNDAPAAIVSAAAADEALLCMATHGRTGVARAVLGSTAEAVVRATPAPAVLVGPRATAPRAWRTIQICVEPALDASVHAVPAAVAMARLLGARLWLTEVLPARRAQAPSDVLEDAALEVLAVDIRHQGIDVEWEVFHGDDVSAELLRAQSVLDASLLVTSSHGRAGIARMALGSVTAALIHKAPCPVLVVPPRRTPAG